MEEQVGLSIDGRSLSQAEGCLRKSFGRVLTSGYRIQSSEQGIDNLCYGVGNLGLRRLRAQAFCR
jgi:hypothetical protein